MDKRILHGIKSRARFLSKRFYFLDKEDLVQDGKEFVINLEKRYPQKLDFEFIMKSINNYYSNIHDVAILKNKTFVNISSLPFGPDAIDEQVDIEAQVIRSEISNILSQDLTDRERRIIGNLQDQLTIEQMANKEGISKAGIYEIIENIIAKRMLIEF